MNKWKFLRNISALIFCSAITAFFLGLFVFKGFLGRKEFIVLFAIFIVFLILTYIFSDLSKKFERKKRRRLRNDSYKNNNYYNTTDTRKTLKDNTIEKIEIVDDKNEIIIEDEVEKSIDSIENSDIIESQEIKNNFLIAYNLVESSDEITTKLLNLWKTLALFLQAKEISNNSSEDAQKEFKSNWLENTYKDNLSFEEFIIKQINLLDENTNSNKSVDENINNISDNNDIEDISSSNNGTTIEDIFSINTQKNTDNIKEDFTFKDSFFNDISIKDDKNEYDTKYIDISNLNSENSNIDETQKITITSKEKELINNDDLDPNKIVVSEEENLINNDNLNDTNLHNSSSPLNFNYDFEPSFFNINSEDNSINENSNSNKDIESSGFEMIVEDSIEEDDTNENIKETDIEFNDETSNPVNIDNISSSPIDDEILLVSDDEKEKPNWLYEYEDFKERENNKDKIDPNSVENIIESISSENDLLSIEDLLNIDLFSRDITEIDNAILSKVDFVYRNIVFLNWCDKKGLGKDSDFYPDEIRYGLNIFLPHNRQEKFISMGLLEKHSYRDMLNSFKVTELKDILRYNDLKVSGLKRDLVNRILKNTDLNNLELTYTLSKKGKELVEKYYPFVKFYGRNDLNISLDNFYLSWLKLEHSGQYDNTPSFVKIIVGAYRAKAYEAAYRNMYSTLREINDDIFDIVYNINDDKDYLQVAIDVICIDLCGLDDDCKINIDTIDLHNDYIKYLIRNSELYNDKYIDRAFDNNNLNNYAIIKDYIKSLIFSILKNPEPEVINTYLKDYRKSLKAKVDLMK